MKRRPRLPLAANRGDCAERAAGFDLTPQDLPGSATAKDPLRAENDRRVARRYRLSDAELTELLQSFQGLTSQRPASLALLPAQNVF